MEIKQNFLVVIALIIVVCGIFIVSGKYDVNTFQFAYSIATKESLAKIINNTPCAYNPINKALENGPIDIGQANEIADKCKREEQSEAERKVQQDALRQISKPNDIEDKDRAATKPEIIDIISSSPCANGPITAAIAGMPISISYARHLGSTCEEVSAQRQRLKHEREEQVQALSYFYE
ncbi:hypothetical protein VSS22_24870 [Klebsiella pneumoniae]|uniref:hypothetical protein n=1 Tax=Klebsiella TaxID=570 RepID=UPI0018C799A9|nr:MULTISPECIES: hypothetical protein [Klebsiella]HCC2748784.1 hypothetical protein [Klebsiella quasipneumoniae]MBD7346076.1 hypothetical protein [Klebsiella pneumoniae]MBD7356935.1 hypothetical protein [Klebsiella pneumoniae]MBD7367566.1 hypothetical protein [Klebsiella pneumoniae]MBD7372931.1 hypothetical protein [Klebsiella pneumoniae]